MKQITDIEEIKHIQLGILSYIDSVCRTNNISYSLAYGTLIGAIRHKGYIPWDDDIDIVLRRSDYDKLVYILQTNKSDIYSVHTHFDKGNYTLPYAKVSDLRTAVYEPGAKGIYGINIDVFPFDYITENCSQRRKITRQVQLLLNMYVLKTIEWRKKRALYKNLFMVFAKILLLPFPRKCLAKKIDAIVRKEGSKPSKLGACLPSGYGDREIIESSVLDNYIDLPFEGFTFMGVKDYDSYLTHIYGDYMKLPPEEERVTHHDFKIYWK